MDKYGKLLAVDDNPAILTALRLCLGGAFEGVVALSDPAKILSVMERENISVVLLDMNFTLGMNTGHDGLLWLRTIRKKFPHIPVVLLTAYGDIGLAVTAMQEAVERSRKVAPLDEVTMDYVHKVVERCDGNISEAAKLLGITRQTLYAKIKRT